MKNKEKKIVRLLEEGFSYDTIKKMNDYHLNRLYESMSVEDSEKLKDSLQGAAMAAKELENSLNNLGEEEFYEDIDEDAVVEELFGKPKIKTPITTLGMFEGELEEKSVSQQQQKIMGLALSVKRGDTPRSEVSKDVLDMVDGMTEKELEDFASTKHKGLPKKKKESKEEKIRQIEESIVSLIKKSQGKMITKGDLLSEQPSIAPSKPTVKPGVKPERGTPYKPKHSPKPKAGTEVKPARPTVKPGTKPERGTPYQPKHSPKPKAGTEVKPARPTVKPGTKPERGTPYQPKHSPKPKAGTESELPEFLKFNNLNIQFRDE